MERSWCCLSHLVSKVKSLEGRREMLIIALTCFKSALVLISEFLFLFYKNIFWVYFKLPNGKKEIPFDSSPNWREKNKVSLEQPFWMLKTTILELKLSLFEKANLFKRFWFLILKAFYVDFKAKKKFAVRWWKLSVGFSFFNILIK